MGEAHQNAIQGDTDSEHVFHWLLSCIEREPAESLISTVRKGVVELREWSLKKDSYAEFALNFILTKANHIVGCRFGRSLWYVERDFVHPCEVCDGAIHVKLGAHTRDYGAVVIASEKITQNEEWTPFQESTLSEIDESMRLKVEPL